MRMHTVNFTETSCIHARVKYIRKYRRWTVGIISVIKDFIKFQLRNRATSKDVAVRCHNHEIYRYSIPVKDNIDIIKEHSSGRVY